MMCCYLWKDVDDMYLLLFIALPNSWTNARLFAFNQSGCTWSDIHTQLNRTILMDHIIIFL